jgi:hypothetical protein
VEAPEAGTAVTPDQAAQEGNAAAADAQDAVAAQAAMPADDGAAQEGEGEGEGDGDGAKPARKKSSRPAHKAPSRKPATRAPRRPAKAKTPPENG